MASPQHQVQAAHVVIVGAGFAGLEAAKALGRAGIDVTLVDRQNHHLFQPLLYQVATAALSAPDIAEPVRAILRPYSSVKVLLGEVVEIDPQARRLVCGHGAELRYDYLLLATGARTGYFGKDHWAEVAPGLKTIEDARLLRTRLLWNFELAERCDDARERERLLTIAVIGGGPTGVEVAGAVAELSRHTLVRDFRRIRPEKARILLIEGGPRLLNGFSEKLSDYALKRLQRLGVTVRLNEMVEEITTDSLWIDGENTPVGLVVWAAGVEASPLGKGLGVDIDKTGRLPVDHCLQVKGLTNVFALGDLALCLDGDGRPLPGLAQVAKQQGRHLGQALAAYIRTGKSIPPFVYHSRGNTAIVGRHAAVYETERFRLTGWFAWMLWAIVHVYLLAGFQNRVRVSFNWLWRYLTYERGARLISGPMTQAQKRMEEAHDEGEPTSPQSAGGREARERPGDPAT